MHTLGRLVVLFFLISTLALAAALWFALSRQPLVSETLRYSPEDVARAERLIRDNDPRRLAPGTRYAVELSDDDLNRLGGYLIQSTTGARSRIEISDDTLRVRVTHSLTQLPIRPYLNVEIDLIDAGRSLQVSHARVGALRLPASLVDWAARRAIATLLSDERLRLSVASIDAVVVGSEGLRLEYTWHPSVIDDAAETLLARMDQVALRHYHDRLVELQQQGIGRRGSLSSVLQPLFNDALERSQRNDPATENAALISLLSAWANRGLERLVPGQLARPGRFRLTLRGRHDFAKHFLISAALSARGDSALSNAVGLVKEIIDTDRGSGFSFTDIAADFAGSRFGELAVDDATARTLQARIAAGVSDDELMPSTSDLPDHMDGAEFERRFERVGSPAYEAMMSEIRQRVATLELYR